jgi:glutamate racemase
VDTEVGPREETENPIGVFDSGVGGLSVLREIRRALPEEDLIYVADSKYAPYGEQSEATIEQRSIAIAEFLVGESAKAIVVACNTATGVAIDALRSRFAVPVVGIEPAVKPATLKTKSGVIAVLATKQTLASAKFSRLVAAYGAEVQVISQPCPGLVEQIEQGDLSSRTTRTLVKACVAPLLAKGADTLVLGCTHYPFLTPVIRDIAGPSVAILDPSVAVASELRRRLQTGGLLSRRERPGRDSFWTSGPLDTAHAAIAQLWTSDVVVKSLPARPLNPRME